MDYMKQNKLTLRLGWMIYSIQNCLKKSGMPKQLEQVADDPSSLPEYQRQVRFLEKYKIDKPYDCFQCRKFDIEIDNCLTKYADIYCGDKRRDRMCPGFDPPETGKFGFGVHSVDDLL
jgi:hypothetical protein